MKILVPIIAVLIFSNTYAQTTCISEGYIVTPRQQKNVQIIEKLVFKYDALTNLKYGQSINLKYSFDSCDTFQLLGGHSREGRIEIEVFSGALKEFNETSIVTAICHELGHIFGKVTLGDAGVYNQSSPKNAVEGEADYFAGRCTLDFFQDFVKAEKAIRLTYWTLFKANIDETISLDEDFLKGNGINSSYPSAECRLLSALNGLTYSPRPKCWYNPKKNGTF